MFSTVSDILRSSGSLIWILLFWIFVAIVVALLFLLRPVFHSVNRFNIKNVRKLFLVTVPKDTGENQQTATENRLDQIREKIAVAESLFASIGGLKAERGFLSWLRGRTDHMSFEIAVQKKVISFYIAVPPRMMQYVQEQIHAQYPDANIEEADVYNIFPRKGTIFSAYLKLTKTHAYPIKTYKKMESDPLSAITNPLSQFEEGDGAVIQFTIRSSHKK